MRLKICCCYCTDEGPKITEERDDRRTLPRIVSEQPKLSQPVQLDKITDVSSDVSAVQSKDDKKADDKVDGPQEVIPGVGASDAEPEADVRDTAEYITRPYSAPAQTYTVSSASSDTSVESEREEEPTIIVNSNRIERTQGGITFNVNAPGQFQAIHNGSEFLIVNGEIQSISGPCTQADKEFVMAKHAEAMAGVQRAMQKLEKGLMKVQTNTQHFATGFEQTLQGTQERNFQAAEPNVQRILANLQQTEEALRPHERPQERVWDREDFRRLLERVRNEVREEDARKAMDVSDSVDELGGYMYEPPLEKTTFSPKELVYEDPKTFESLDTFEVPDAKRADEYIISKDEQSRTRNEYYFHAARPKRARKRTLDRKQRLQIASPDRYSLFEGECLKWHNKFRSMHGVPPLVNNTFLCKVAREWAEHLALNDAFYHRPKNEYGENLYRGDRVYVCAEKAVTAWYEEIELYDYNNPKFEKATGHFTQVIWKDTREMGTGVAVIGDQVWVCCNYHPPGNHTNKFNDEFVPRPVVIPKK